MMSPNLPAVLQIPNNSISVERALKQFKELLLGFPSTDNPTEDRIQASLDTIDLMLAAIDRN